MMNIARRFVWLFALVAIPVWTLTALACPFCEGEKGLTLVGYFDEAKIVLYGHFENPRSGDSGESLGETDFIIEKVLKSHDLLKNKQKIVIKREVRDPKSKFIVYCDIYKDKIDAYKGIPLSNNTEMLTYIEKAIELKDKPQPIRLRHAFDYLNSPEIEVALDAYREYSRADYTDYKEMAKTLPADKIAGWLRDPKTPPFRYGLYASLLGHCGKDEHAKLLLSMIEDPEKRKGSGLHGLMAAYLMLEPAKGWSYLKELSQDKQKPFLVRYAGLQTMRFLWENRRDLVKEEEIIKGVAGVLNVADMADFAIEDLRKWKRWEYCDQIVELFGKKTYNIPIIRKSILRFALQCPAPRAVSFVRDQRERDREWVDETKELLDLETVTAPTTTTK